MKLNIMIITVLIVMGASVTYWFQTRPPLAQPLPAGQSEQITVQRVPLSAASELDMVLPSFSVTDLNGHQFTDADFLGKPLVINFWASWCLPCIAEFPKLLSVARDYPDDFVLLLLSSDMDVEAIETFSRRLTERDRAVLSQDNVVMVWDDMQAVTARVFGVSALPETYIVTAQGHITSKLVGANWEESDISRHIVQRQDSEETIDGMTD